jgi:hypothetical protein
MSLRGPGNDAPPKYPRYVRALAVAYVLSLGVQYVGFLVLGGAGAVRYGLRGQIDGWVVGLLVAGVGCALLCPAYRRWFRRWGRRHYPPQEINANRPRP